ncbi:hypothetical protein CF8_0230 [Aeromonas phage CF8]|nr:hypothetical protein CF8_0230 [Aeromonas phage CF8]
MERAVNNIISISNIYELVSATMKKVGYEYQAPLTDAEEQEITSREIKTILEQKQ